MQTNQSSLGLQNKPFEKSISSQKIKKILFQNKGLIKNQQNLSAEKLLRTHVSAFKQKTSYIKKVDGLLRSFCRLEPTLQYSQTHSVLEMIQSLLRRVKKQKQIHGAVCQRERQTIDDYEDKCNRASEEIEYLKELLNEQQRQQQNWKKQALKLQQSNYVLQRDNTSKAQSIKVAQEQIKSLKIQVNKLSTQLETIQHDKTLISRKYLQKSDENKALIGQIAKQKQEIDRLKKQLTQTIASSLKKQSQNNTWLTRISSDLKSTSELQIIRRNLFGHFFAGDVLQHQHQARNYLVQTLQTHHKNAIFSTRLLYRMDHLNKTNVHYYVDNHPHLVVLIQTQRGHLIGAYSQGSFRPKIISNHAGMLFALRAQRIFKNIKKAIVYDQNQIIFGNCELRIINGDNKVSSNFGLNGGFYQGKGESIELILGVTNAREVRMKNFQIFEVTYQE